MAKQQQGVSPEDLSSYQQQCAALSQDWQRLGEMIEGFGDAGSERQRLEDDYIGLRCTLSCDYPILAYWRNGGYGLSAGIHRMITAGTTLAALAESAAQPQGRARKQWQDVRNSLDKVAVALQEAQRALRDGKEPQLPRELIRNDVHVPFPIKKVLKIAGVAVAIVLAAGTLYVMRHFLGFWAPGAGSGHEVTADMTDEQQIEAVLVTMARAFQQDDVDLFMTVVADDFRDEDGNGKRALRVALQVYAETGAFGAVSMDWSKMRITERGGFLDARPIYIIAPDERITIHLGFRDYRGKLLIATGSAA